MSNRRQTFGDRLWVRLGAFGLALAAAFGIGAAIGAAVGPLDVDGDDHPVAVDTTVAADHGGH